MEYRQLGRTGLKVSTLALGTVAWRTDMARGSGSHVAPTDAGRILDACLDAGINLVDTADVYGDGQSETLIGQVLGKRRPSVLLATKVRFSRSGGPNDAGLSRRQIITACEASLKRLKTDWIDLYQVHGWDGLTPLEETLDALNRLVEAGKVRYIGCSNYSGWHLMKSLWVADRNGHRRFESQQIHYTLFSREAEQELLPIGLDQGVGVLVWSPLATGLLSGKIDRSSADLNTWREPPAPDTNRLFRILDVVRAIATHHSATVAQVAQAWLLNRRVVTSVIIGPRTFAECLDSIGSTALTLSAHECARLDDASATPLGYPYWHQAATVADRLSVADLLLLSPHLSR
ncbi:aldo/keto reductase [Rhizobium sp. CF142]|uniref:aldo/keto reductase n=1 Tax=Rhizobium sp. CF142 TaxID=1144314 RepID=UPI00026EEB01|nr:aldo/keto reductase [Rhizobium sp. CF142]EJJ31513.1 putative oxidoreductase, aryl-alcohol dehydrogenase like protein [Rhizobium sp. CF142]